LNGQLYSAVSALNNPSFVNNRDSGQAHAKAVARAHASGESEAAGGEITVLLEDFLETIVKSVGASGGSVRVFSPDGRELNIAGAVGLPPEIHACDGHVHKGCGVCGDALRDDKLRSSDAAICAGLSGSEFFRSGCKSVVAVPLQFRGERIGVFNLFFDSKREIVGDAASALRTFAALIGISLENTRLARENRRMSLMAERQAIANEIHDSLAQTLTFGRMRMTVLQEAVRREDNELAQKCIEDVKEALDGGKKSVRELITHFRCQMDPLGLRHALQVLAGEFAGRTGIEMEYSNGVVDFSMPLEHELQVFHIVREVLANIAAHAGASHASLTVSRTEGRYVFNIEDNGAGMPGNAMPEGHYGLTIMRERARRIGAEIHVESTKGKGTWVRLSLAANLRSVESD
jgi:two-component system nitrate/nitrite sensor histidine kinase NarX